MRDSSDENYHRLLRRQLKKVGIGKNIEERGFNAFISLVDASYKNFDEERKLNERAEKISSQELKEINLTLQEKNRFLDSFNHGLAHDAKNHTANLKGLLRMFTKYQTLQDFEKMNVISQKLEKSVSQMTSLLDGFLYLSSERVDIELGRELVDFKILETGVLLEIEYLYQRDRHEIVIDFDGKELYYSQHIIKIILVNLISNALKFSKSTGKNKVLAKVFQEDKFVNLEVSDTGTGMDLDDETTTMYKLFDRRSNAKQIKGYGIGLYLIKNILDRNNGDIAIESKLREGTTIKINLPLTVQ